MSVASDKLASVLDARPFELTDEQKGPLFRANLLEELVHHYESNEMYRKFCQKNDFDPHSFAGDIAA